MKLPLMLMALSASALAFGADASSLLEKGAVLHIPFSGNCKSIGTDTRNITGRDSGQDPYFTATEGPRQGAYLNGHYQDGSFQAKFPFSAVAYALAPRSSRRGIVSFGRNSNAIVLASGDNANEVQIATINSSTKVETPILRAKAIGSQTTQHLYGMTISADARTVELYVDGELAASTTLEEPLTVSSQISFGGMVGGFIWGGQYKAADKDGSFIDEFLYYNRVLTAEEMSALAGEFPMIRGVAKYHFSFSGNVKTNDERYQINGSDSAPTYLNDATESPYAVYLKHNSQNGGLSLAYPFTAFAYALAPSGSKKVICSFGQRGKGLVLSTGSSTDELCLVKTVDGNPTTLISAHVEDLSTVKHLFTVTASEDGRTFALYADGELVGETTVEEQVARSTGIQLGGVYGGNPSGYNKADGNSYMDELIVFEGPLFTAEEIRAMSITYPAEIPALQTPDYRWTFDGTCETSDSTKSSTFTGFDHGAKYTADGKALILYSGAQTPNNSFGIGKGDPKTFSTLFRATCPSEAKKIMIGFGDRTGHGFFLATGDTADEVRLVTVQDSIQSVVASVKIPDAATTYHTYVMSASVSQKVYNLFVDGEKIASVPSEKAPDNIYTYMQLGGMHGGAPSGYASPSSKDNAAVDELRIYNGLLIGAGQAGNLADEFLVLASAKYDYPFYRDTVSIGTLKTALPNRDNGPKFTFDVGDARGVYLSCNVAGQLAIGQTFTALAYAMVPADAHRCIVSFGTNRNGLFLATGAEKDEIELVALNDGEVDVLARAKVVDLAGAIRLFGLAVSNDGASFALYVDGQLVAKAMRETAPAQNGFVQVGGWYGGNPSGYAKGNGESFMANLAIYDGIVLHGAAMSEFAKAWPVILNSDRVLKKGLIIHVR